MPSSQSVQVEGRLTFQDVLSCIYLYSYWSSWKASLVAFCAVLSLLVVLIGLGLSAYDPERNLLTNIAGALIIFAFWVWLLVVCPYRYARLLLQSSLISQECKHTVDPEGYSSLSASSQSRVEWTAVREVRESKRMFLICYSPVLGVLLPKRFFPDESSLAAFRSLLANHVPPVPLRTGGILARFL